MAEEYEDYVMEPELRPEFIEKMKRVEKQKGIPFKNMAELRKRIEEKISHWTSFLKLFKRQNIL